MAVLATVASGNFTSSATWCVVDSTSYNNSETTTTALTTSYQTSSTFTPGAITISHIGIKLSVRTGTTGTISVALDQGGSDVAGTTVTINTADFPVAATADVNGGWHFFKLSSPVTLLGATAYGVKAKTSSSAQISLFSTATTNWSRALVTTTMQAPVAGDDLIINGEYTGAGTSNSFTVTMNETATTDYGSAATSLVTPAISICNKGTLTNGSSVSTNYNLKVSGNIVVYSGGIFNIGTVGGEIPRTSTYTLLMDCVSNVDFGIVVRNLGTFRAQGLSRTSGKNVIECTLTSDVAINGTTLNVDTDTGWLSGDEIAIASTTRTASQHESGTLNGNASASSLTVNGFAGAGGGVANAHSGTSPVQADIILLNRNIVIKGVSTTVQTYIDIKATATIDWDWVEFRYLGSNTSNKKGIDIGTSTGSFSAQYCSFRDFTVSGSVALNIASNTSTNNIEIAYCTLYKNQSGIIAGQATATPTTYIIKFVYILGGSGLSSFQIALSNFTECHDIIIASQTSTNAAFNTAIGTNSAINCNIYNFKIYGNAGVGVAFSGFVCVGNYYIYNFNIFRNSSNGMNIANYSQIRLDSFSFFGNSSNNIATAGQTIDFDFTNSSFSGDTTFSTGNGVSLSGNQTFSGIRFTSCTFGVSSGIYNGHTVADFGGLNTTSSTLSPFVRVLLNNTKLASTTEVQTPTIWGSAGNIIASQKHDQTAGLHKTWKGSGNLTIETTTTKSGGQSMKMTPLFSTRKLDSSGYFGGFKVPVANTKTCTPSIWVYEDGSYNGARARLIVKRNDAMGITSDTVLATATAASDAAWENLTGTTAAVTDDGVLEFVVDCDGTAGNLYIDEFSATTA